jgi:hypothetical protein
VCNEAGHLQYHCPIVKKAIAEITKKKQGSAVVAYTQQDDDDNDDCAFCTLNTTIEEIVAIADTKGEGRVDLYNDVFLDTASSANIFRNADLLAHIRATSKPITVKGMGGGSIKASMIGDYPMFGEVYYHPDSIANILSFYDNSKTCKLRYNSDRNSFYVTGNHKHSIVFEPIDSVNYMSIVAIPSLH